MAKDKITGLILREDSLDWATLQQKGKNSAVVASGNVSFEPVVEQDSDDIAPESEITVSGQIKEECNKFKGNIVVAGIPTERLLLRVLELPNVPADELRGMVELQADKFSPFPIDNMVVGYEILHTDKDRGVYTVLVAAINKETADKLDGIFKDTGIVAQRLDASILGRYQLLLDAGGFKDSGRQIYLFEDGKTTEIIIVRNGIPVVFRSFPGLNVMEGVKLYSEIAEELSHTLISMEISAVDDMETEIHIYNTEDDESKKDEYIEVVKQKCDCNVFISSINILGFTAIGIARREMAGGSNLLDLTSSVWREQERIASFHKSLIISASVVLLLWLIGVGALFGTIWYYNYMLSSLNTELATWKKSSMKVRSMRRRVFMIDRYRDQKQSALECLRAVSMVQPQGIDLKAFDYKKNKRVKISGEASNVGMIYDFKSALDTNDLFTSSDLIGPRNDSHKHKELFDIIMNLPEGEK